MNQDDGLGPRVTAEDLLTWLRDQDATEPDPRCPLCSWEVPRTYSLELQVPTQTDSPVVVTGEPVIVLTVECARCGGASFTLRG